MSDSYYKEPTGNDVRSENIRRRNRGVPAIGAKPISCTLRALYDGYDPLPEWKKVPPKPKQDLVRER